MWYIQFRWVRRRLSTGGAISKSFVIACRKKYNNYLIFNYLGTVCTMTRDFPFLIFSYLKTTRSLTFLFIIDFQSGSNEQAGSRGDSLRRQWKQLVRNRIFRLWRTETGWLLHLMVWLAPTNSSSSKIFSKILNRCRRKKILFLPIIGRILGRISTGSYIWTPSRTARASHGEDAVISRNSHSPGSSTLATSMIISLRWV